jgi:hypothetical protein
MASVSIYDGEELKMLKLRIIGWGGETEVPNTGPIGNFLKIFLRSGFELVTGPNSEKVDLFIALNASATAIKELETAPKEKRVLIIFEPKCIVPANFDPFILNQFGLIICASPIFAKQLNCLHSINWPQDPFDKDIESFDSWRGRNNSPVIMQTNKVNTRKGEMYTLRRKVIAKLNSEIIVFGNEWNRRKYQEFGMWISKAILTPIAEFKISSLLKLGLHVKNYQGPTPNKYDALSNYKLNIVIENSLDYISEKMFDSLSANCYTIFVGPDIDIFDLELGTANQVSPKVSEIVSVVLKYMQLPIEEQYLLMKAQKLKALEVIQSWDANVVLNGVANQILGYLYH